MSVIGKTSGSVEVRISPRESDTKEGVPFLSRFILVLKESKGPVKGLWFRTLHGSCELVRQNGVSLTTLLDVSTLRTFIDSRFFSPPHPP